DGRRAEREEVEKEVDVEEIEFPVAWDEEGAASAAYKVKEYPMAFLVGKTGRVLWKGAPSPKKSEGRIRRALGIGRT
ncbi:MAG TPA: hypothetical protein VKF62_10485, partial [Planctomycetota bacterium]|nr:hypothetical protein [Planctomycetota bacterium]